MQIDSQITVKTGRKTNREKSGLNTKPWRKRFRMNETDEKFLILTDGWMK